LGAGGSGTGRRGKLRRQSVIHSRWTLRPHQSPEEVSGDEFSEGHLADDAARTGIADEVGAGADAFGDMLDLEVFGDTDEAFEGVSGDLGVFMLELAHEKAARIRELLRYNLAQDVLVRRRHPGTEGGAINGACT